MLLADDELQKDPSDGAHELIDDHRHWRGRNWCHKDSQQNDGEARIGSRGVLLDHVYHRGSCAHLGPVSICSRGRRKIYELNLLRYFDNFPHGHYGTIRQQIWSLLHFPFQLAIVGVVEGSQQVALARYVAKNTRKVTTSILQYCQTDHLDGQKLQDKLQYLLEYFELDSKYETKSFYNQAQSAIWSVGNATNICSQQNTTEYNMGEEDDDWPGALKNVSHLLNNGLYTGLGMKIPVDKLKDYSPLEVGLKGFELVYLYFWSSFCLLLVCLIIFLLLIRRHKADLFDFTSIIFRSLTLGVGGAMLALMADTERLHAVIESPALLPICVVFLFLILVSDKLSSIY